MIFWILKHLFYLVLFLCILAAGRTWQLEHTTLQSKFLEGITLNPAPDGFYKGTTPDFKTGWLGKTFKASENSGFNSFDASSMFKDKTFPFKTYTAAGIKDTNRVVFAIDYNIPASPFYLHPIVDEIVQTEPGHYIGKLQVRIIPGFPFTLSFFELQK